MIKTFSIAVTTLVLCATAASAQNCTSYPNTLANGQNADADQVMANFNHVRNCVINAPTPGVDDTTRRNLLLNTALLAKAIGGYVRNLNVFADGYKASDGINAGASANFSVDTANGRVAPSSTSGGDQTATHTADTTSGNTSSASSINGGSAFYAAWKAVDKVNSTDWINNGGGTGWWKYQFASAKVIVEVRIRSRDSIGNQSPKTFTIEGSNNDSSWTTLSTVSNSTGWSASEERNFTFSNSTAYTYYRVNVTATDSNSNVAMAEIKLISTGAINNMTLVTTSQTADATVTKNRVLLEYNPVDAITLNTDLTAEVTCNNGTNWTAATLTLIGSGQSGNKIVETADTTCGTSGTSFAARIKTLNNKNVQIYKTTVSVQ